MGHLFFKNWFIYGSTFENSCSGKSLPKVNLSTPYPSWLFVKPSGDNCLGYQNWVTRGPGGGRHSTFFQVGVCGPDFWSVGACELTFASEKGGLWAEIFQIWRLVSWKFPNLGACELKILGLWAKIWVKIEAVEAKISKFSQKGVLWTDSFAWNGTLASGRRGVKGGLQGRTSPYPLSRSVPPPRARGLKLGTLIFNVKSKCFECWRTRRQKWKNRTKVLK